MSVLFFILLAIGQAFGIGCALIVDHVTWKWRNDESADLVMNYLAMFIIALVILLLALAYLPVQSVLTGLVGFMLWFLSAAFIQTRQYPISFYAAFYGAAMQLWCFCIAWCLNWFFFLAGVAFEILLNVPGNQVQLTLPFDLSLISAIVCHVAFTFLRPQLNSGWQQIKSKKLW